MLFYRTCHEQSCRALSLPRTEPGGFRGHSYSYLFLALSPHVFKLPSSTDSSSDFSEDRGISCSSQLRPIQADNRAAIMAATAISTFLDTAGGVPTQVFGCHLANGVGYIFPLSEQALLNSNNHAASRIFIVSSHDSSPSEYRTFSFSDSDPALLSAWLDRIGTLRTTAIKSLCLTESFCFNDLSSFYLEVQAIKSMLAKVPHLQSFEFLVDLDLGWDAEGRPGPSSKRLGERMTASVIQSAKELSRSHPILKHIVHVQWLSKVAVRIRLLAQRPSPNTMQVNLSDILTGVKTDAC